MAKAVAKRSFKTGGHLTEAQKVAIITMRAQRKSTRQIAFCIGRTQRCVESFLKKAREAVAGAPELEYDVKADLEMRAIDAVADGLEYKKEPYKRGNLAVNVLKGLGVFQPDSAQVNVNTLIASTPPEMRDRYFISTEDSNGKG